MDPKIVYNTQQALKTFLTERILSMSKGLDTELEGEITLSFVAPDKAFYDKQVNDEPTVNCYLIGVAEDTTRRQSEPPRSYLNTAQTHRVYYKEPRFVSLTYMLTVWSKAEAGSAELEHMVLSYLLCGLGAYDFLPEEILAMYGVEDKPYGIRTQLFGNEHSEKVSGHVWQALGSTPKPTLLLSLSVPVPVFTPDILPVIQDIETNMDNKSV
ncbi:Pvc16 family protein [Pseudoalteromonas luteoviolacea]|uniref:Pvc16 N-terminal domain-containing protein n=1 Tax=Pseudoalteromonas luteoviolacea S4054 TaxID=1129367 RepID=A0A0F6ADL1_9GAMM|nr:Pvc16 family protein [Pseudoalteromonas luteoviolacea]AOT08530.1 hypothetical protein S4054249_12020 [Pseudoalteromonas luteoviolacea]AOT13446.1 hypothetical protein S40542_11995 [Pseudoalteromonas luteoviolacea]AOT18359.1 hypothetical protein S4054_11995 [Pseudoalteromonas luteoviolacea]KKE83474.1 hypothetical protein N479_13970 [Pseudoalteromonas luteoviolacea S4054]KZN75911.1 hypothetical protein N481_06065 [Pseudoalteromonas luteoviolacea S4047-1]